MGYDGGILRFPQYTKSGKKNLEGEGQKSNLKSIFIDINYYLLRVEIQIVKEIECSILREQMLKASES